MHTRFSRALPRNITTLRASLTASFAAIFESPVAYHVADRVVSGGGDIGKYQWQELQCQENDLDRRMISQREVELMNVMDMSTHV